MRRRIVGLAAGTTLLAVLLLSIPLGLVARSGYLRDERLELQQVATTAAARALGDVLTTRPRSGAHTLDGGEVDATLYDASGKRVSGRGPTVAPVMVRAALSGNEASTVTSRTITVAAPVSDGDQIVAALLLSTSTDAAEHRTYRAWLLLAAMDVVAVLVAAGAAVLITRRLARSLDQVAETARRMGEGDLAARAETTGITEIDALATALNGTVERVGSMLSRERALSAEVSHQLRTPLSGLRLELESARRGLRGADAATAEGAVRAVHRALDAVDRLDSTITDVIALARDLPAPSEVDATALMNAVVDRWHGTLAVVGRPLRVLTGRDAPRWLAISRAAATQILDVLMDNALRHGAGAVTVSLRPAGADLAVVEVADEGPALAVEAWQLFSSRNHEEGHGLGLPFARRLAQAEGARLTLVGGDPPTFALTVPTSAPAEADHRRAAVSAEG